MAAIGIDLGTTFSCVAAVVNGKVEIIPNKRGNYITPSCVSFTKHGVLIGEDAKANLSEDPSNTILNVKRIIGLRKDAPVFKAETAGLPYEIIEKDGEIAIQICVDGNSEDYYPEEISGKVLSEMKQIAEDYLGTEVVSAVITVPARFNGLQRQKTRDAAEYAKLNVLRLLHEPTAAALAYGLQNEEKGDGRHVLVYDLGGGTFDVNVLTINDGEFKILASAGNTHLGGEDFDKMMVDECIYEFAKSEGIDLGKDLTAKYRLRKECEKTKIALSSVLSDEVNVEKISGEKNLKKKFGRAKFEHMNEDSFEATMEAVDSALRDADLERKQIDEIVLVGGSTRIPYVQEMLRNYFKKQLCMSLDADQAVAYGAAICAAKMTGNFTREIIIRDVIPLSLGIMTKGGVMSVVIKRNKEYPTSQYRSYTTVDDNQTRIRFSVYEGERAKVALNHLLGSFVLDGIPPQLAGKPSIRVQFKIDIHGLLQVTAIDQATGATNNIVIEWQKLSLNVARAELAVRLAEESKEEDEAWKSKIQTANELESNAKKLISILSDSTKTTKLPEEEKLTAETIANGILSWLELNPDPTNDEIKTKLEELKKYSDI